MLKYLIRLFPFKTRTFSLLYPHAAGAILYLALLTSNLKELLVGFVPGDRLQAAAWKDVA